MNSREAIDEDEVLFADLGAAIAELADAGEHLTLNGVNALRNRAISLAKRYERRRQRVLSQPPQPAERAPKLDFNAPFYRLTDGKTYELQPFAASTIRLERDDSVSASGSYDNQDGLTLLVRGSGNFSVPLFSSARPDGLPYDELAKLTRVIGSDRTGDSGIPYVFYIVIDPVTLKIGGVVRRDGAEHVWFKTA